MKIKGLDKLNKFIDKASKLLDTSEFYAKASIIMLADVQRNFDRKKNSDGSSWKPLKYRKGKRLRDTDDLLLSITKFYDTKNAIVGTNIFYAPYQHYGTKNIPKSEFMFLSEQGGLQIEKMTVNMLGKL